MHDDAASGSPAGGFGTGAADGFRRVANEVHQYPPHHLTVDGDRHRIVREVPLHVDVVGEDDVVCPLFGELGTEVSELLGALPQEVPQARLAQLSAGQARETGEVADEAAQRADLLLDDLQRRVQQCPVLDVDPRVLAMTFLNGELNGRQGVLDLVRQTLRHLLPGPDPLQILDSRAGLLHLAKHAVEDARELGELV